MLDSIFSKYKNIRVIENVIESGSLYEKILDYKEQKQYKSRVYKHLFDTDMIIPHGSLKDLYEHYEFSIDNFINIIKEVNGND